MQRFTKAELKRIARLRAEGASFDAIAARMKRRKSAVHKALVELIAHLNAADRLYFRALQAWRMADRIAANIADPQAQAADAELVLLLRDFAAYLLREVNKHLRSAHCAPVTEDRLIADAAKLAQGADVADLLPTASEWGFLVRGDDAAR